MTQHAYQSLWDTRLTVPHCERMHILHKLDWDTWAAQRAKRLNYGQNLDEPLEPLSQNAIANLTQQLSMSIEEKLR